MLLLFVWFPLIRFATLLTIVSIDLLSVECYLLIWVWSLLPFRPPFQGPWVPRERRSARDTKTRNKIIGEAPRLLLLLRCRENNCALWTKPCVQEYDLFYIRGHSCIILAWFTHHFDNILGSFWHDPRRTNRAKGTNKGQNWRRIWAELGQNWSRIRISLCRIDKDFL